jgi:hypothetical protein
MNTSDLLEWLEQERRWTEGEYNASRDPMRMAHFDGRLYILRILLRKVKQMESLEGEQR